MELVLSEYEDIASRGRFSYMFQLESCIHNVIQTSLCAMWARELLGHYALIILGSLLAFWDLYVLRLGRLS